MAQAKQRPNVDTHVYDLAANFLTDYTPLPSETGREDLEWELADYIQQTIEAWIEDARIHGRISER